LFDTLLAEDSDVGETSPLKQRLQGELPVMPVPQIEGWIEQCER
jgi:hypothetical protein